jgi:hypothetical protein
VNNRALDFIASSSRNPFGFTRGIPNPTHLDRYISPVQFERLAHDIRMWREAIREMEMAWYPQRVRTIRMYMDTVINPYIKSIMERWEDLTLQRDFFIYQVKGGKKEISKDLSQQIQELAWFHDYVKYTLHAEAWGYSLINLGDIIDDGFPNISFTRRENIRPDGGTNGEGGPILTSLVYSIDGIHITDSKDPMIGLCNHWIQTPSNIGVSKCGYGLLYETAMAEIHLRHITEWNMDYIENHGMPIKKGTTSKTGKDRDAFERFLQNAASNSWVLLDKATNDNIEYEWAQSVGTAWKSYDNMEMRLQGVVSQLWLGHTDAMKSTPGKLGGQQAANKDGFNESLIEQSMNSKRIRYGNFVTRKINEVFAPKMRQLGAYVGNKHLGGLIPSGYFLGLQNDAEETQVRRRINAERLISSQWAKNLNEAGFNVNANELGEFMKLKLTEAPPEKKLIEERETTTITKNDKNEQPETNG